MTIDAFAETRHGGGTKITKFTKITKKYGLVIFVAFVIFVPAAVGRFSECRCEAMTQLFSEARVVAGSMTISDSASNSAMTTSWTAVPR